MALKLLAPHMLASDADRSRFYREARAAAALHHPHIATVFEIDETEDGRPFIAMEYIEGAQLDEGLSERPLPVDQAVEIAIQIAEAQTRAWR
ncbi:MAG: serine/threonine protein kinase [Rhodothermales bacterium]